MSLLKWKNKGVLELSGNTSGLILQGLAGLRVWQPGSTFHPPGKIWLWGKETLTGEE